MIDKKTNCEIDHKTAHRRPEQAQRRSGIVELSNRCDSCSACSASLRSWIRPTRVTRLKDDVQCQAFPIGGSTNDRNDYRPATDARSFRFRGSYSAQAKSPIKNARRPYQQSQPVAVGGPSSICWKLQSFRSVPLCGCRADTECHVPMKVEHQRIGSVDIS